MGVQFWGPDAQQGLLVGATPEWQLAAQKVAQGDMFKNGLPTVDSTPNGALDLGAMAKIAYRNGAIDQGNGLLSAALSQQQMGAASKAISGMNAWAAPSSGANPAPASSSAGAMPLFRSAISGVESGGKYDAQGPVTETGDRAYGKYQVMGANIPAWTKEILGTAMTPDQFLANPQAQDAVFDSKFGGYLKQTGNPQDASSMWFTGKPYAQGAGAADQLGTTGADYVAKVMTALRSGAAAQGARSGMTAGVTSDGTSAPAGPTANAQTPATSSPPLQVAQNGTSDAPSSVGTSSVSNDPPPGSTHPYGAATPAFAGPTGSNARILPASAPMPAQGQSAQPAPAPLPTAFASPPKPSPNAGDLTSPTDPTFGGQVPQAWIAAGHSAADWVRYQRSMAGLAGTNPYLKAAGEQWAKSADDLQTSINKQAELTSEQKNARDPLVLQQEVQRDVSRARARADAALDTALVPVAQPDGSMTMIPKRLALAQAASGNGPVQSLPGYVTSGQQNLLTKLNDGSAAYAERQVASERLDALSDLLSTFQTGANTGAFGDAKARLASIGIPIPASAMKDVASMQQFTKDAYANVLSSMKDQGNKQYAAEVQSAVNSNPNVELQPAANAAMIAQMKGIKAYHDANFQDYADWYNANKGASNDAQFQIAWAKKNPLSSYVTSAAKNIAPMGVPLPPRSQLVDGQAYMVQGANGPVKARWSATASHFIPVGR